MVGRSAVRTPRRRRDWADFQVGGVGLVAGAPQRFNILADWVATGQGSLEGVTTGQQHWDILLSGPAAGVVKVDMGLIVTPRLITTVADYNPATVPYLDWMYVGTLFVSASGATNNSAVVRALHLASKRKLQAAQNTVSLLLVSNAAVTFSARARVLLYLP